MTNKELKEKIARLETELAEVKEVAEAMKKRADGGVFMPKDEQEYWIIEDEGSVYMDLWDNHRVDRSRYEIGNCYPTKQAAEDAIRALKLTQKVRESQNGFVPDWENFEQTKNTLCFDMGEVLIMRYISGSIAPIFGFWEYESVCEQFIHENREDLLWYFTEYRR